jgi:hypothetical protein
MKRQIAAVCGAGMLAAVSAAPATAFEPIEGVWRTETSTSAEYLIQQSAPGVFKMTTIHGNAHCMPDESGFRALLGEEMEVRGSGLDYVYDPVYRFNSTCEIDGVGQGIARVTDTDPQNYRHVLCSARPGTGAPQFDANYQPTSANTVCRFGVRIREPEKPVSLGAIARKPRAPRCTPARRARGRVATLRLRNYANEPVLALQVRLGKRLRYRYEYPGALRRTVKLRLPKRGVRLRVTVETTSNKNFRRGWRYGACKPRKVRR